MNTFAILQGGEIDIRNYVYENDFGSIILFQCHISTLQLEWRRLLQEGINKFNICNRGEEETVQYFLLHCSILEECLRVDYGMQRKDCNHVFYSAGVAARRQKAFRDALNQQEANEQRTEECKQDKRDGSQKSEAQGC